MKNLTQPWPDTNLTGLTDAGHEIQAADHPALAGSHPSTPEASTRVWGAPEAEDNPLLLWAGDAADRDASRSPGALARAALLRGPDDDAWEKGVYAVLAATVVASLMLAFWQLHSLEAGWASFAQLVGRVIS